MDFGEIKKYISEIMDTLDHAYLNEINEFSQQPPSSENIARYIAEDLQRRINTPGITVSRLSAWESNNSCSTYIA